MRTNGSIPIVPEPLAERARRIGARYPGDFIWGAATAAAQIEGAVRADGRTDSIWDTFARVPGAVAGADTLDVADDHHARWREDVALMKDLGLDAYRFSIAWPRVVPAADGHVEERGIDFYDRLVDELLAHEIAPYVTLYHWDLPQWQQDAGGWPDRSTAERYAEYAAIVARRLGDRVPSWMTLNEPWVFTFLGHLDGIHAPGERSEECAVRAMHHALLAHGMGVQALRAEVRADAEVGIALSMTPTEAASDRTEDLDAASRYDLYRNWLFLHPIMRGVYHPQTSDLFAVEPPVRPGDMEIISQPIDYVGINYYSRGVVRADDSVPASRAALTHPEGKYTAMGWEVFPQGLANIITQTHERYAPPAIYVTENGSAWDDAVDAGGDVVDENRVAYLLDHLEAAAERTKAGVPLRGYFAWSLLDNFEWAEGYSKRFGLIHVDYDTQQRTIKQSGAVYRAISGG